MSVKFNDNQTEITADATKHTAHPLSSISWGVTWLRADHRLTRTQAITAMVLAEFIEAREGIRKIMTTEQAAAMLGREGWRHANGWAHELGLDGAAAINMILDPRKWEPE